MLGRLSSRDLFFVVALLQGCGADVEVPVTQETEPCRAPDMVLDGAIDGEIVPPVIEYSWDGNASAGSGSVTVLTGGFVALITANSTELGIQPARAWLRLNEDDPWHTAGNGTTLRVEDPFAGRPSRDIFILRSLVRLPSCKDGEVVDVIATYCPGGFNEFCEAGFTWTVNGSTEFLPTGGAGGSGSSRTATSGGLPTGGRVLITYNDENDDIGGLVVLPDENEDSGALYCIRGGKRELETPDGLNAFYTLDDLVRVGSRPEGTSEEGSVAGGFCQ